MEKIKVIILGTGNVSSYAVKALSKRSSIELIGVWAHPETAGFDIGKDAGELRFNTEKVGVQVTGDLDALIDLKPDCAVIGVNAPNLDEIATPLAVKCLEAGINVVGTSLTRMIYPKTCSGIYAEQIKEACAKGHSSFFMSGIHPGFGCDYLATALLTDAHKVENVTAVEIMDYRMAPNEFEMKMGRGFGEKPEYKAVCEDPNFIIGTWGPCVDYIAGALGYQVEEYKASYQKAITDHDLTVAYGVIPAGTVGAVRLTCTGVINGKDAITVGNVNRMGDGIAPEWEMADKSTYRITVTGDPCLTMDFCPGYDNAWGYGTTCLRAINAIPYVVAAKEGMLSAQDLPVTVPTEAFE